MFYLFGTNPFGSALFWLLLVALAGTLAAWSPRIWVGGAVTAAMVAILLHPRVIIRWPTVFVALTLIGFTAGVMGWALRRRRLRLAAVGGSWTGAGLALFHLYIRSGQPHSTADLVFAGGLLVTILVLGCLTVVALPPDDVRSGQVPPSA